MPRSSRPHLRVRSVLVTVAAACLVASAARAATPEQQCQQGRYTAAAKYAACQHKAAAKLYAGGASQSFEVATGKCHSKYTAIWVRLQAKATGTGSSCDNPRFANNGDGTVTDRLTGLRWEQKTSLDATVNLPDPHDADNLYTWNAGGMGFTAPDGDVFTSFLAALNGSCFAGQCDWRLPTLPELQTLLLAPPPCGTIPCLDPVFGPTSADKHWTGTGSATFPTDAWTGDFNFGLPVTSMKTFGWHVRAVRGGL